jgi:hypothetical protein
MGAPPGSDPVCIAAVPMKRDRQGERSQQILDRNRKVISRTSGDQRAMTAILTQCPGIDLSAGLLQVPSRLSSKPRFPDVVFLRVARKHHAKEPRNVQRRNFSIPPRTAKPFRIL